MAAVSNELSGKIPDQLSTILIERQQSLAVAESVTAGYLQVSLSLAKKAMDFFQGGITTYNIGQKTRHLQVDPIHALACNAVSERIAVTMAKNVAILFNSDWGIGITGYASPVPEENIEELFACFAISFRDSTILSKTITVKKDAPSIVRIRYTNHVLKELLSILKSGS